MQDITKRLPHLHESVLDHAITTFSETLPIPIPDTPENRAAQHAAAIEAFVALNPADAAEAALAQMVVIAELTAAWCDQRIAQPDITAHLAERFAKQANSMRKFARSSQRYFSKSKRQRPPAAQRRNASPPAALTLSEQRAAAAKAYRAARIRALDLRVIEMPPTMH